MADGYYAHSVPGEFDANRWEALYDHLEHVARIARGFAAAFAAGEWGELAGRWHDLGKYQKAFQKRIRGERIQVPHAGTGAAWAFRLNRQAGLPLAFVIAGHHTGLPNLETRAGITPLLETVRENDRSLDEVIVAAKLDASQVVMPTLVSCIQEKEAKAACRAAAFFTRMLFSALVDADRLATEAFYDRSEGKTNRADHLKCDSLGTLQSRLDRFIDRFAPQDGKPLSAVNQLRADVLADCRAAASRRTGLFSLTVPTGGGKTLSAMSFALRHALAHDLRRVIVVIPFTSILDQNAQRYRQALAVDGEPDALNVLEHHSGVDEERAMQANSEAEIRRRLAVENWDAPIVVTTTVQFFESLFSNHPSRCRKLHRIANSVVILDEVQTLPPAFLIPIVDSLRQLSTNYGCSVVLSTATPPALAKRDDFPHGLTDIEPIIADSAALFRSSAARRVRTTWRIERPTPYADLATELAARPQVLAIVHRRQDARTLAELLPASGRLHLSALMCPAHRLEVIAKVRERLQSGKTCRLVSTQLIEAGVDVDFPVVYRALAGLDSLAQSAGRCDREGKLSEAAGAPAGAFVVFRAETSPPPGTLRKTLDATEKLYHLLADEDDRDQNTGREQSTALDPFDPSHGESFFRELYSNESLDAKSIQRDLAALDFETVAGNFKLISDGSLPIAVTWKEGKERIEAFQAQPCRNTLRALQPFLVSVRRHYFDHLVSIGAIESWEGSLGIPTSLFEGRYDAEFGLAIDTSAVIVPDLLMI